MKLGLAVPQVYIVPVERFCREMGPALGVNLAEFEFPAYFNFFVYQKRCTLVVDSEDAEDNIRRVFSETLLGPSQFRRDIDPVKYEEEDFDPSFPKEAIPDFEKELRHFRIMPNGKELDIETLLNFRHFETRTDERLALLGVPPTSDAADEVEQNSDSSDDDDDGLGLDGALDHDEGDGEAVPDSFKEVEKRELERAWTYSQVRFMGTYACFAGEIACSLVGLPYIYIFLSR
jgi:hypothetical protein